MMIDWADLKNGERRPAKVFDAEGKRYRRVRRLDTETGEMWRVATDPPGGEGKVLLNDERDVLEIHEHVPAPVIVEFKE